MTNINLFYERKNDAIKFIEDFAPIVLEDKNKNKKKQQKNAIEREGVKILTLIQIQSKINKSSCTSKNNQ